MSPKTALRVSSVLYILLGIMVWSVIWLTPEMGAPLSQTNPIPSDVITTARGWGDINGTLFTGVGLMLFLCGQNNGKEGAREVMNKILLANIILSTVLIAMALFHTFVLNHGPPPPVFIATGVSIVVSFLGRKSIAAS